MHIQTTRFGVLKIDEQSLLIFSRGLIGFPAQQRFALVPSSDNPAFSWLQAADDPDLAFLVVDPSIFFKEYTVPIREEAEQELQLTDPADGQVLVICGKVGDWLTGNLLGPIVINTTTRCAQQIVLTEKKWTTRQPLAKL